MMNINLTKCLLFAGVLMTSCLNAQAPAADPTPEAKKDTPLSITGQVDAYFRSSSAKVGGLTSYTGAHNGFSLGMANIALSKDMGKVSFVADLMFGPRAEETNYNYKTNSLAFLKQLYVSYKPSDKVKFTIGNFMTFVGYELVEASNNLNYSMSYNYTNGPFFHTGLKAEFTLTENLTLMAGVFEPTDYKNGIFATGGNLNVGGQLAYVNGGFKVYLNAITGKTPLTDTINFDSKATVLDLTASYQVTPKFGLGVNVLNKGVTYLVNDKVSLAKSAFTGLAVYANYAVSDQFTLAARGESFNDSKGVVFGVSPKIAAFTLSGNFKVDALTIIPELRFDKADQAIFGTKKTAISYLLAAVYKF
jgi:Putative beta-barrel porin-2, OmpL-like. bbp2